MRSARRRVQDSAPRGGVLLLNLSLFLMLLSFFIILNNISSFEEEKYHPILQSLRTTFASTVLSREDNAPSVSADPFESINEGHTIERIDALFRAQISGFETNKSLARGIMAVTLSLEEFERVLTSPNQIDLTRAQPRGSLQTYFVPTLISLMASYEQGTPYRMEMIFHTKDTPALLYNSDPRALSAVRQQSAVYADMLEKAGLGSDLLGIGLMQGDPAQVMLVFRPLEAGK